MDIYIPNRRWRNFQLFLFFFGQFHYQTQPAVSIFFFFFFRVSIHLHWVTFWRLNNYLFISLSFSYHHKHIFFYFCRNFELLNFYFNDHFPQSKDFYDKNEKKHKVYMWYNKLNNSLEYHCNQIELID